VQPMSLRELSSVTYVPEGALYCHTPACRRIMVCSVPSDDRRSSLCIGSPFGLGTCSVVTYYLLLQGSFRDLF
jgi:hypothetical protein